MKFLINVILLMLLIGCKTKQTITTTKTDTIYVDKIKIDSVRIKEIVEVEKPKIITIKELCDTLGNAKEFNLDLGGVTAKIENNALEINIDSIKQYYKEQYYNQYRRDSLMVSRDIKINSKKIKYKPTKWTYWSTFINFFLILAILAYFRYKFS